MKAASDILERRRSERNRPDSRYVGDYSLPLPPMADIRQERGRPSSRYSSLNLQQPPSRSTTATSSASAGNASAGSDPTSGSLWGLLDMAQSWLSGHTSRRDRSEERSKYLMRKTRPLWFHEILFTPSSTRSWYYWQLTRNFFDTYPIWRLHSTFDPRFSE